MAAPPKTRAGPARAIAGRVAVGGVRRHVPRAQLSHVFSLQRPIDANARESSFLAYQTVLPLESFQLAAAGMRSNSVRASVVHKAKKTQGGGQQTTRNSLQDLSAELRVAVGVGGRRHGRGAPRLWPRLRPWGHDRHHPRAIRRRRHAAEGGPFVATSSTRLLPHALPIRIGAHNLLATMRGFASRELEAGMIRSLVPQQVASLRSICVKICDRADGVNVWAAWVLLIHMLSDPRLRKLVQASPITDHEVSAAYLFTNYARAEVTRRARMDQAANQKRAKTGKAVLREDAEAGPSRNASFARAQARCGIRATPGTDMEGVAEFYAQAAEDGDVDPELARGVKVACEQLGAARKLRKGTGSAAGSEADALAQAQATALLGRRAGLGRRPRLLGRRAQLRVRVHPQDHDHAVAQPRQPGLGRDAHGPGAARVQQRAQRPAAGHLHAQRGQERRRRSRGWSSPTPERVPKIVTWRCRNAEGRLKHAHGPRALVVRRLQHHRARRAHAARAPAGASGHTKVLWSLAVRNATPHDASTSLVPGIVEGIAHLHALATRQAPAAQQPHYTARVLEPIKQQTQRVGVRRRA